MSLEGDDDTTGDDTPDAAPASPSCQEATTHADLAWIQDNIFSKSCAFSGCHKGTAVNAGSLSLEKGVSHDALVGKPATTKSGMTRVAVGMPAASYLLIAMGGEPGPMPSGGLMPQGQPKLCPEKLDAVKRWIEGGAKP